MIKCIWCKEADKPPAIEHIIPDALGCPENFILADGSVCQACNNGLGHIDQAVVDEFDLLAFMHNVPRKGRRSPEIRTRGNMVATRLKDEVEISINMERYPVYGHDGTKLGAFGKSPRNINASMRVNDELGDISFSVSIDGNPKFARGIVKIAFGSLAYFLGNELASSIDFDPIRSFVKEGRGTRPILLTVSSDEGYKNQAWPPFRSEKDEYVSLFRLAAFEFCVDLSPNATAFATLKDKARELYGASGWTYLPLDKN